MIAPGALAQRLDSDGEFRLTSRQWTATVRLDVGTQSYAIRLEDGRIRTVTACAGGSPCDVFVSAPPTTWERLLEPVPRPFYQDLLAAVMHHGVMMNADLLDIAAYYPALRRLLEILRELPR